MCEMTLLSVSAVMMTDEVTELKRRTKLGKIETQLCLLLENVVVVVQRTLREGGRLECNLGRRG